MTRVSTKPIDGAGRAKAWRQSSPSSPTLDHRQAHAVRFASRGLVCGRGHIVSNHNQERVPLCRISAVDAFSPLRNLPEVSASGLFHSHWRAGCPLYLLRHRRVSPLAILLPAGRGTRQPIRTIRLQSGLVQSLPDELVFQCLALRVVHLKRLSSSLSSRGIDPNENGLTHAQISFAPGAKAYD